MVEIADDYFNAVKSKITELNETIERSPIVIKIHNEKLELIDEIIKIRLIDLLKSDSLLINQIKSQAIQKFVLSLTQIHVDSLSLDLNLTYANLSIEEWQIFYNEKFNEAKKFVKNNFKYNDFITIPNLIEGTKFKGTSPAKYLNFVIGVVTGINPKITSNELINLKNGESIRGYQFSFYKNGNVHIKILRKEQ